MLKPTPFYSRTFPLCQPHNWRNWSGWLAAGSYEMMPDREYYAIRSAAALLDISPLYKYLVTGPDAVKLLNRIVTRDVSKCKVGQVIYTPWCDAAGKVLDDGTVSRLAPDTFRLTSAESNYHWFVENAFGLNVVVRDASAEVAALALQGPKSRHVLNQISEEPLDSLKYFYLTETKLAGLPATVSRTGYTGDLGYEIWLDPKHAEPLWDALMEAGRGYGLTPAGILALDIARVEAGLIMLDVDYTSANRALIEARKSSPFEIGLGWTVSLDKGNFVGRKALAAEKQNGSRWQLVGMEVDWEALEAMYAEEGLPPSLPALAWRSDIPVYADGVQVGYATSGTWSPILKKYIAMAHVESGHAKEGTPLTMEVTVEHKRRQAPATVAKMPFFNPERKRQ
jgi:aminomethyltransferase